MCELRLIILDIFRKKVKCTIDCKNTNLSFRLNVEPSTYFVTLTYPENWDTLTAQQKEEISREVSLELGAVFHIYNDDMARGVNMVWI